jgi:hypothetical protein
VPRSGNRYVNRALAAVTANLYIECHFLIVFQGGHPRFLERGVMHKHILATYVRCDEAEALLGVEPFHCAIGHVSLPYLTAALDMRQLGCVQQCLALWADKGKQGVE